MPLIELAELAQRWHDLNHIAQQTQCVRASSLGGARVRGRYSNLLHAAARHAGATLRGRRRHKYVCMLTDYSRRLHIVGGVIVPHLIGHLDPPKVRLDEQHVLGSATSPSGFLCRAPQYSVVSIPVHLRVALVQRVSHPLVLEEEVADRRTAVLVHMPIDDDGAAAKLCTHIRGKRHVALLAERWQVLSSSPREHRIRQVACLAANVILLHSDSRATPTAAAAATVVQESAAAATGPSTTTVVWHAAAFMLPAKESAAAAIQIGILGGR